MNSKIQIINNIDVDSYLEGFEGNEFQRRRHYDTYWFGKELLAEKFREHLSSIPVKSVTIELYGPINDWKFKIKNCSIWYYLFLWIKIRRFVSQMSRRSGFRELDPDNPINNDVS